LTRNDDGKSLGTRFQHRAAPHEHFARKIENRIASRSSQGLAITPFRSQKNAITVGPLKTTTFTLCAAAPVGSQRRTQKGEKVIGTSKLTVSKDGKVIVVDSTRTTATGAKVHDAQVYDKQ
jgi:hypothetical protein